MKLIEWFKKLFQRKQKLTPLTEMEVSQALQMKVPIYVLGEADPFCFMNGLDIQVWFNEKRVVVAQMVAFTENVDGRGHGELTLLGTPGSNGVKELLDAKEGHLKIVCASEYGKVETAFDAPVKFLFYKWGVSIDDLIVDTIVTFQVKKEESNNGKEEEEG